MEPGYKEHLPLTENLTGPRNKKCHLERSQVTAHQMTQRYVTEDLILSNITARTNRGKQLLSLKRKSFNVETKRGKQQIFCTVQFF